MPTSNQSPRTNRGCWLLGPAALCTCPLASPRSQARARLGSGGYCRRSRNGAPRLACLRPMAWLCERARTAHLHQQAFETLARGQASRGRQHKTSSGASSPGWLAREGEIKARQTSQGSRDVSHDDQDQAGVRRASACTVSFFPLWCKGGKRSRGVPRHQTKVSILVQ